MTQCGVQLVWLPYRFGLENTPIAPLQRDKTSPVYDTEASDGEAPAMELWGMWSAPSKSLPGVVVPVRGRWVK